MNGGEFLAGGIGFLFGGGGVALFSYVKFNGRLIETTTTLKDHIKNEEKWQVRVDGKLKTICERMDTLCKGGK